MARTVPRPDAVPVDRVTRRATLAVVCAVLALGQPCRAADEAARAESAAELAREFSDPLTTLPQIVVNEAYTTERHETEAEAPLVGGRRSQELR